MHSNGKRFVVSLAMFEWIYEWKQKWSEWARKILSKQRERLLSSVLLTGFRYVEIFYVIQFFFSLLWERNENMWIVWRQRRRRQWKTTTTMTDDTDVYVPYTGSTWLWILRSQRKEIVVRTNEKKKKKIYNNQRYVNVIRVAPTNHTIVCIWCVCMFLRWININNISISLARFHSCNVISGDCLTFCLFYFSMSVRALGFIAPTTVISSG